MHSSLSHHKFKRTLSGQGLKTGDAGGIDKLLGDIAAISKRLVGPV